MMQLAASKGPCHEEVKRAKPNLLGAFIPQCTEDGYYEASQCHGSTGHCWCVTKEGEELQGTRTGPGEETVSCDATGKEKKEIRHTDDFTFTLSHNC